MSTKYRSSDAPWFNSPARSPNFGVLNSHTNNRYLIAGQGQLINIQKEIKGANPV